MYKFILLITLLISNSVTAEPIKLIMHDGATIAVITKHLNMPVVPIMIDMKDGSPLVRAGIATANSIIFAGSNQFVDQSLFSDPESDILNFLKPIAIISKSSIALATSSKTNNTLDDIVDIAKKERRPIKMSGTGFNNVCHFLSGYLTRKYDVEFVYIEYNKIPQLDVDLYNQLIDVSCKFGVAIEDESKRKYYNIIANFSKGDKTGSLSNVLTFEDLPDITTHYILFGNTSEKDTKIIVDSIKNVKENDWLSKNHVFLDIDTNIDNIVSVIDNKRLTIYNLIKLDQNFNKKIKNTPILAQENQ